VGQIFTTDDDLPRPIEARYCTPEPNVPVLLYEGRLRIVQGSDAVEGDGTIKARWLPQTKIAFIIPSIVFGFGRFDECTVELVDRGWSCKGTIESRGYGGLRGIVDRAEGGVRSGGGPSGVRVAEVRAHVPNFLRIRGEPLARPNGNGWYNGRRRVEVAPWRLTLDELESKPGEALKETGGIALTHALACQRIDSAAFAPDEVDEFIELLDTVLSFCAGLWTGGTLATGHDATGALVWEHWRLPWLSSYEQRRTWFPSYYVENVFETIVPAFAKASADPVVKRVLRTCLHWYLEANACHAGLEGSIVMALTALELLAWDELVNRGTTTPDSFDHEAAFSKIRRYLTAKGIPFATVPTELLAVDAFAKTEGCADGVEVLTRIRNRTVHPPKGSFKDFPFPVLEQAWRYAICLVERSILAEVGYKGHMTERLGWTDIVI
jgi:hypothetical protein